MTRKVRFACDQEGGERRKDVDRPELDLFIAHLNTTVSGSGGGGWKKENGLMVLDVRRFRFYTPWKAESLVLDRYCARGETSDVVVMKDGGGFEVAVKVCRRKESEKWWEEGFLRTEPRKHAKVADHRNIISIFASGETETHFYIVMELAKHSLDTMIHAKSGDEDNRLAEKVAAQCVGDIACALRHCHSHGVVHRDVNPRNIVLGSDGAFKLIDFGVSVILGPNEKSVNAYGHRLYRAPEMIHRRQFGYGEKVDIFSLGLTLFEMLYGSTDRHDHWRSRRFYFCRFPRRHMSWESKCLIRSMTAYRPWMRPSANRILRNEWIAKRTSKGIT